MEALYDYATGLGVHIEHKARLNGTRVGEYYDPTRTVYLMNGMAYRKERSVLAHELAHATYGDIPSMFEQYNKRQEDRADEWAAHFLINHDDYRLAEEKYGTHTAWIAQELGVLERLVKAYERTLTRIGDTIYVKPNLGIAQQRIRA